MPSTAVVQDRGAGTLPPLGQKVGYSGAQVGKVETSERAPSQDFAEGCDRAVPEACGLFLRLYQLARRWDGGYPSWFTQWVEAERRASTLPTWQPLILPGLLQTPDYARALFLAWRGSDSDAELDELVSAHIERQAIFQPPNPPSLWAASARRVPAATAAALPLGGQAVGVAALLLIRGPAGFVLFVVLFGAGIGVLSIARPDLLARYAPRHLYARLSGVQALLVIAGEAAGPTAAAVLHAATGSYTPVCLAVALCSLCAALLLLAADRAHRRAVDTYREDSESSADMRSSAAGTSQ